PGYVEQQPPQRLRHRPGIADVERGKRLVHHPKPVLKLIGSSQEALSSDSSQSRRRSALPLVLFQPVRSSDQLGSTFTDSPGFAQRQSQAGSGVMVRSV